MTSFPPRHICIVSGLVISAGVAAVIGMIAGLIGGHFSLNLALLGIPIGYGILIGKSTSRKLALFFASVGFLFSAGFGGWALYSYFSGAAELPPEVVYTVPGLILTLGSCTYVVIVLTRSTNRPWFEGEKEAPAPLKSVAWAVAIGVAGSLAPTLVVEWQVAEMYRQIYAFRVNIAPYDSISGRGLNSVSFDTEAFRISHDKLPKISVESGRGRDGMELEFFGVAARPIEITIKSEGYRDTTITVDEDSDEEIRVSMPPLEIDTPQESGEEAKQSVGAVLPSLDRADSE